MRIDRLTKSVQWSLGVGISTIVRHFPNGSRPYTRLQPVRYCSLLQLLALLNSLSPAIETNLSSIFIVLLAIFLSFCSWTMVSIIRCYGECPYSTEADVNSIWNSSAKPLPAHSCREQSKPSKSKSASDKQMDGLIHQFCGITGAK